jgi:tetratricopeptide (TPR) repeat protein
LAIAEIVHDYDTIVSLFDKCAGEYKVEQILYWKADYSAKAGMYDDAVRYITELISGEDDAEDILYLTSHRCEYYRLAGKYAEAIKDAESLIERYPDYAYGYYICGWCYELMGDDTNAMVYYNKGIEADDSYAYIYLMRGEQYLKYGDVERAKTDFERVLELDTKVADGSCRHYALHFLGRDNEAIEWLERIIDANPYDSGHRYDEACLYARMGNVEQSLYALSNALYLGYKSKAHIENDDELDPIRHTEAYKTLMNEYFN